MRKTSSDIQNASNAGPGTLVDVPVTQKHEQTPFTNTPYTPSHVRTPSPLSSCGKRYAHTYDGADEGTRNQELENAGLLAHAISNKSKLKGCLLGPPLIGKAVDIRTEPYRFEPRGAPSQRSACCAAFCNAIVMTTRKECSSGTSTLLSSVSLSRWRRYCAGQVVLQHAREQDALGALQHLLGGHVGQRDRLRC